MKSPTPVRASWMADGIVKRGDGFRPAIGGSLRVTVGDPAIEEHSSVIEQVERGFEVPLAHGLVGVPDRLLDTPIRQAATAQQGCLNALVGVSSRGNIPSSRASSTASSTLRLTPLRDSPQTLFTYSRKDDRCLIAKRRVM